MSRVLRTLVLVIFALLASEGRPQEVVTPATPDTIKNLRERASRDRTQADGDQKRADVLRELAQKARRSAESTRDPAQKMSWIEDAKRREADAKGLESSVTRLRAAAVEKEARAARLEAAYNKKYSRKPEPLAPKRASGPESPPEPEWRVEDIVGLWVRAGEPGFTLALVPQLPDQPAMVNRIEVHSDRRVWAGTFYGASRDGPARAVMTYTPKPEEMNPKIPPWARQAVAGKLIWRMELAPAGDPFDPTLKIKWHPGEVGWTEGEQAGVIGPGKPLEFELEPIDTVNIEALSYPTVAVKLPNAAHDPDRDPVEALTKGQRFFVRVTLPVEMAREKGSKISAVVRSLAGGGEERIELTGAIGNSRRAVVYTHGDQVTLADCNVTEPQRTPPFLSWNWVLGRIWDFDAGDCLDIKVKNGDLVEIRYDDAAVQVPVYGSWVQRGIVRHVEGAARLRVIYQSLLVGPYDRAVKEAAHKRLRMLDNYEALRGSDKLSDLHRYFVGEAYLGDTVPALLQAQDAALNARYHQDLTDPPVRTDSTYFTPMLQAALEGLTGKDLSPKAWTAGKSIVWTSEAEQFYILRVIRRTSARLAEDSLKATYENLAFGLYDGIATGTPAGGLYLIVSGKDHFGRPQPRWVRIMAAVGLASDAVLHLHGPTAATLFVERLHRRLPSAVGKVFQTTLIAKPQAVSQSAGHAAPPGVPKSVQGAKRQALSLELTPDPPSEGAFDCPPPRPSRRRVRSLVESEGGSIEDFSREIVQKEARDYVDRRWGSDTKIVDPELDAEAQEGPTCLAMVANRSVSKGNGKKIPLQRARVELLDLLIEDVQAGRRTVAEVVQMGSSIGYDDKVIRRYLRKYGARVGAIKKVGNHDVKLGHIKAGLKKGWMVKTTVRFGPDSTGNYTYHAVLVEDLVINPATGRVAAVRVYDPMVGVIEVPRKRFIELFKGAAYFKNNKKEYLLMFIRFDSV